jgi:hypothetical protein
MLGRELVAMGHELKVLTFYRHAYHGFDLTGTDEDYVSRCFTHARFNPVTMEAIPFITSDYEYFIAEDIGMLPKDHLAKLFESHIKKKAKTVHVYHDNSLSDDPSFYQFDWDAVVSFDDRFKELLLQAFPAEKVHIIPYPCASWEPGDKAEARRALDLPADKKIIFTFGDNTGRILNCVESVDRISDRYPILLLALSRDRLVAEKYEKLRSEVGFEILFRELSPAHHAIYEYLWASDALLYYRDHVKGAVVASTITQCLGAGCPVVGNATRYTEPHSDEIFKYNSDDEMVDALCNIFDETEKCRRVIAKAEEYVNKTSARKTAEHFVELYEEL